MPLKSNSIKIQPKFDFEIMKIKCLMYIKGRFLIDFNFWRTIGYYVHLFIWVTRKQNEKKFVFFLNEIFFCDSNFDDPLCAHVTLFAPLDLVIEEMRIFFISPVTEAAFVRCFRLLLGTWTTWRDSNPKNYLISVSIRNLYCHLDAYY